MGFLVSTVGHYDPAMSDDADFISIIDPFARTALRQAGYRLYVDVIRTFLSSLAASMAVYRSGGRDEPGA